MNRYIESIASGASTAIMIKAGVYDSVVMIGINQFIIITETAAILPAKPAKVPTEGPLKRSLDNV